MPENISKGRSNGVIDMMTVPSLDLKAQYAAIRSEVREAMDRVCESQHFILGPEVSALEAEVAAFCRTRFAIGVSSGTDALLASLMAIGIGPGDEVITTTYSFFCNGWSDCPVWRPPCLRGYRSIDLQSRCWGNV